MRRVPRPERRRDRVLVLLPAYNEATTVGRIVREVHSFGYDAVVIDDGSTDATGDEADTAGATVLRLPVNVGVGGALRCGFRYAVSQGYSSVVHCDADGQHDPREIPRLLAALETTGSDMVIGTRFASDDAAYDVDRSRRLVMRILASIASGAVGVRLTDSTSGFRAIRTPLLEEFAERYPVEYLGDTVEALIQAGRAGYRVAEEPVRMSPRSAGTPTASLAAGFWYLARVLVAIKLLQPARDRRHPALPSSHGVVP
jgi:glycosyltransferase involved in cell wall biosynthesis